MTGWPSIKLNGSDASIPGIGYGLGTAHYKKTGPNGVNDELVDYILLAFKAGYRHIDCAQMYANGSSFGAAFQKSGLERKDFFLTSKVAVGVDDVVSRLKEDLAQFKTDYLDLYLIHDPTCGDKLNIGVGDVWKQLEKCKDLGLVKDMRVPQLFLGISNFSQSHIESVLAVAKEPIAANQIELHPYVIKEAQPLLDFCRSKGIVIEAYGPSAPVHKLAGGSADGAIAQVGKELSSQAGRPVTSTQVLLKWAQAKGAVVVTTSSKFSRMQEQLEAGDLPDLSSAQVEAIQKALNQDVIAGESGPTQRLYMAHAFAK